MKRSEWQKAMHNLMSRRTAGPRLSTQGDSIEAQRIRDYRAHLSKVFIGASVLDVGCGDMGIAKHLTQDVKYLGIDAFPINDKVMKMEIENMLFDDAAFDTVLCFAVLDGVCDIDKALAQMYRVCKRNIVFLTGIGIEPDQYHTYKITEEILYAAMPRTMVMHKEYLSPHVLLIEFQKP